MENAQLFNGNLQLPRLSSSQPVGNMLNDVFRRTHGINFDILNGKKVDKPIPAKPSNPLRYKTEICRNFEEGSVCRFGETCTFAHGTAELRAIPHHPKYKTELCRTFHTQGQCQYGVRCHFIHDMSDQDTLRFNLARGLANNMFPGRQTNQVVLSGMNNLLKLNSLQQASDYLANAQAYTNRALSNNRTLDAMNLGCYGASTVGSLLPDTTKFCLPQYDSDVNSNITTSLDRFLWSQESSSKSSDDQSWEMSKVPSLQYIDTPDEFSNRDPRFDNFLGLPVTK